MAISLQNKFFIRETLCSVLAGLIGKYTVIDLRNEVAIYGQITHVSGFMNVELKKCVLKNPKGDLFPFTTFYVKNRNIRYVHIPEGYTSKQLAELGLQSIKKPLKVFPDNRNKAFKTKRAQTYQNQILQELSTQKES